ncbi:MAG: DNA mismatch repair protein MutS [Lachnospiraceae bacterium]|nr:DNA mismatch repair protein MutS [Lachnospiraceae bacterium]
MMKQYLLTKEEYKDCILFYRLGDFYEMFFDDAKLVSRELELVLTGKSCGLPERAPMCGIPYHSSETYINRLVAKGYKVAICEQTEDPKLAKGLVKREVVRIVTPGTIMSESALDDSRNNYLMSICDLEDNFGVALCDLSTGEFLVTQTDELKKTIDEIIKFGPSEIICNDAFLISGINIDDIRDRLRISVSSLDSHFFDEDIINRTIKEQFGVNSIAGLGLTDFPVGLISAGSLLLYLMDTQKTSLGHISHIKPYSIDKYMVLDSYSRRNLELTETLREKNKKGSLLGILDRTKTAMGARLLRFYTEQPLIDEEEINLRLDAVSDFTANIIARDEIREYLSSIYDLERLMGRVSCMSANPKDLIALKQSLSMLPHIKTVLGEFDSKLLKEFCHELDTLADIKDLIERAILDEPSLLIREGDIIKSGFNEDVDKYRAAKTEGKSWVAELAEKEKERTGIKNLKVNYNKVFGYYLEVSNANKDLVPDNYIRKQTLANAERYITPELKELEDTILGAEEKLKSLEYELFCNIREEIASNVGRIQTVAGIISATDVFASLSYVAERNNYVRPSLNKKGIINIKGGRHPVVEKMIVNDMFIENDTYLDEKKNRISIITGPNMAGKSTYMRQSALIVLMAQIGSFVPAREADISIVDRIFTRVGASDDLSSGQSTFMVEMTEVANILRNATSKSLIILDEIGRGTSTFDGLSIAWAVAEYIADPKLGAKTLFATHYHELTELEDRIDCVNNYCIAVKEQGDDIVFLRKIIKGGADKSYGIQVAKLAGVPEVVTDRAKEILEGLIAADTRKSEKAPLKEEYSQMSLFDYMASANDDIINEIKRIRIDELTPIDALNLLSDIQKKLS